jgi:hypothetical protein
MCQITFYFPYVNYDYLEADSLVRERFNSNFALNVEQKATLCPHDLRGELSVDPDTRKNRKQEIIRKFSHYIRICIFHYLLTQRNHKPRSEEQLNTITKQAIIHIIKHVDVSGDNWDSRQCMSQVDELLAQFLHNFRFPY